MFYFSASDAKKLKTLKQTRKSPIFTSLIIQTTSKIDGILHDLLYNGLKYFIKMRCTSNKFKMLATIFYLIDLLL